jgi:hypothetical protein
MNLLRKRRQTEDKQLLYDFQDIVDEDETQAYEDYISEVLCGRLVESAPFRLVVLAAIVLNTALVGLATNTGRSMMRTRCVLVRTINYIDVDCCFLVVLIIDIARHWTAEIQAFDKAFLTLFTLEILLKWYNGFTSFWKVGWNWFDFILVFTSIVGDGITHRCLASARLARFTPPFTIL